MTLTVDKEIFMKTLSIADSAISSKNSNSILSNCLFEIDNNFMTISGTDNDISVKCRMDIISDDKISFLINSKKLLQITKEMPKGEIDINIDDLYNITVLSKSKNIKGKYKLSGISNDDYPVINNFDTTDLIKINQNIIKEMINCVSYAASNDVIKPSFNGVYFISEKKGFLSFVASDSRRLALTSRKINDDINIKDGFIIPLKTIHEIQRLLSSGDCFIAFKNNQFFMKTENVEIISKIIDGQFPKFRQVVPVDYIKKVFIKKEILNEALRRIMVFTKEPSYKVHLIFEKNVMKIESKTPDIGEGYEEVEIESNSEDKISIGINSQYLMDSIKEINSVNIELGITGSMSPLCVKAENDENSVSVVMPIQLKKGDSED